MSSPPDVEGCDCLFDNPWSPDGCYENLGEDIECSSNQYCWERIE